MTKLTINNKSKNKVITPDKERYYSSRLKLLNTIVNKLIGGVEETLAKIATISSIIIKDLLIQIPFEFN